MRVIKHPPFDVGARMSRAQDAPEAEVVFEGGGRIDFHLRTSHETFMYAIFWFLFLYPHN